MNLKLSNNKCVYPDGVHSISVKPNMLKYNEIKNIKEWAKKYNHVMELCYKDLYPNDKYWYDEYYYSTDNIKKIMKIQRYIIEKKQLPKYLIIYGQKISRQFVNDIWIEPIVINHFKNIQRHIRGYLARLKIICSYQSAIELFEEKVEEVKKQTELYEKYNKILEEKEKMDKIIFMNKMALFIGSIIYSRNNSSTIPSNENNPSSFNNPAEVPSARNIQAPLVVCENDMVGKAAIGVGLGVVTLKLIKGGITIALTGGTGGIGLLFSFVF